MASKVLFCVFCVKKKIENEFLSRRSIRFDFLKKSGNVLFDFFKKNRVDNMSSAPNAT